ncbi:MAG: RNA polymerase sporulation sigma factor SigE [Lachnospiraceae bacterium]
MVIKVAVPHQFKLRVIPNFKTFLFPEKKDVHYIGGSEVLPAPLETEEETKVINNLGSEYDETAKKTLIEHNLRLVVYIAKKFDNTGIGVEDLISIGTIGLIKAINTFNPTKNIKLATYASRCIENEILMYLRRNNKTKLEVSIDEPLNVDWDGNELLLSDILGTDEDTIYKDLEAEVERKLLVRAMNHLSHRERTIVELRFGLGTPNGEEQTQKEVADLLGISQSYISRLEKKIMQRLRREMVKYEQGA